MGIPSGRFSSLPGFGIQTLRVGLLLPVNLSCPMSFIRASGDRFLTPSTPAVFFPLFSVVTRRTAKALFDQDLSSVFWSFRTCLMSPQREAA